jgi:DNA (cytosine-5)-methyltransferase 1
MGIDWMTRRELDESIPPAYTEYVGEFLLLAVTRDQLEAA